MPTDPLLAFCSWDTRCFSSLLSFWRLVQVDVVFTKFSLSSRMGSLWQENQWNFSSKWMSCCCCKTVRTVTSSHSYMLDKQRIANASYMQPSNFFLILCEILAHRLWPLMPHSQLREDTRLLPRIAACKVLKIAECLTTWHLTQLWGWTSFTLLIDCSHDMRSI